MGIEELYKISKENSYIKNKIEKQIENNNNLLIDKDKKLKDLAIDIAYFSLINSFYDIITIYKNSKVDLKTISSVYFKVRDRLYIDQIIELLSKSKNLDYIEKLAFSYIESELRKIILNIVNKQLKDYKNVDKLSFIDNQDKMNNYDKFIKKIFSGNEENKFVVVQMIVSKLKFLTENNNIT